MIITKSAVQQVFRENHRQIGKGPWANDSLFSGNLGLAYYYSLLYQVNHHPDDKELAIELLEGVLNRFTETGGNLLKYTYSGGAAGLGYALSHLNETLELEIDLADELKDLDEYLYSSAINLLNAGNVDCLHGALGIVHYFAKRGSSGYLDRLVPAVCKNAIAGNRGIWFKNMVENLATGEGEANLSLSHGLTGILLILLESASFLSAASLSLLQHVLTEGIRFILSFALQPDDDDGRYAYFPPSVEVEHNKYDSNCRLAWCYGDLGIALLLYRAGKLLNDRVLLEKGHEIGLGSLRRKTARETEVIDPYFCHGSAGLATFYYTLYLESQEEAYLDANNYWIEETIRFFDNSNSGSMEARQYPHGLLDGLVGVNLTLLSYFNHHKIPWSGIFFL